MDNKKLHEKIELIRGVELFAKLSDQELEVVAINSELIRFQKGKLIFTENTQSNELYIIRDGEVLISRVRDNDDVDIAQLIAGESFGEWDFIGNTPRTATAVAMRDTEVLVFPREGGTFGMFLLRYPKMSARILHKLLTIIVERIKTTQQLINEKTPWIRNLKKQMMVDKLTGLFNRNYLAEDLDAILDRCRAETSLLIIKPDNFKEINDRHGHEAGDKTLLIMSIFIGSALRATDIPIRYGGDEFAVILPETFRDEAIAIARELGIAMHGIDLAGITGDEDIKITVSIGIAASSECSGSAGLMNEAHEKMMDARSRGGNRIRIRAAS